MGKKSLKPSATLFPVPVVMVTSQDEGSRANIITLAWVGVVNSIPPMIGIAMQPSRYSSKIIKKTREFVVNIPSEDLLRATDFCGTASGENIDKFETTGLTGVPAERIKAPLIAQCPVNLECVVKQVVPLGSHDLFIGEVVALHVEETILRQDGSINIEKAIPFVYCPGAREYRGLHRVIGTYGFTKGEV